MDTAPFEQIANRLRFYILKMTWGAQSGHPTSSFSSVELATVLFFKYLRADLDHPESLSNDRVIFSKGHASALLYSLYSVAGKLTEKELMSYRTFESVLEGHPTHRFPFAEAATGSLGQGLSIGVGEAWGIRKNLESGIGNFGNSTNSDPNTKYVDRYSLPRVYVLLGDGEMAEGSNWEAAAWASKQKLSNIVAIVDLNGFGQSDETMSGHDPVSLDRRFTAFGWTTLVIDGHNIKEIDAAFQKAHDHQKGPVAIIAKTIKGKGVPYWEDKNGWHNKMLPEEEYEKALAFFKPDGNVVGEVKKPEGTDGVSFMVHSITKHVSVDERRTTRYEPEALVTTKQAFGKAIERLGAVYPELIVLDGDVSNSLHTDQFKKTFPERFLQMYIAEQNMVGVATGLSKIGFKPLVATFACFLTRAFDQFRLLPLSNITLFVHGSYAGVSLGKDGPSQMGLEDIAMFRSIAGSTVLHPSDPYMTERLVEAMIEQSGVVYLRTIREQTPVIYGPEDTFVIGGCKVHEAHEVSEYQSVKVSEQKSKNVDTLTPDTLTPIPTIIASGITVHKALKAQKELASEGTQVRVIDCYSIKPIDEKTIRDVARRSSTIVIAEDHYPEGGLGEAVKSVIVGCVDIPIVHLAVRKLPRSGKAEELLVFEEISAKAIMDAIRSHKK